MTVPAISWGLAQGIRDYLQVLAALSLSSPASRNGDDGFPSIINHLRTLKGSASHLRREDPGCYRIDFTKVRL